MSLATTDDPHPGASTLWPAPIMTPRLQPPDAGHLHAGEGWVGLGDYAAAEDELERIAALSRAHPDVLQLRWRI